MEIVCPNCSIKFPLQAGANDANARRFAAAMGRVPPVMSQELLAYLNFFKPQKQGLTWAKALKRIDELLPLIEAEQIKHNGRNWFAPAHVWKEALTTMLDQQASLTLPMSNHNYLFKIIASMADKVEAKQERDIESQRKSRKVEDTPGLIELRELRADKLQQEGLQAINFSRSREQIIEQIDERIKQLTQS